MNTKGIHFSNNVKDCEVFTLDGFVDDEVEQEEGQVE